MSLSSNNWLTLISHSELLLEGQITDIHSNITAKGTFRAYLKNKNRSLLIIPEQAHIKHPSYPHSLYSLDALHEASDYALLRLQQVDHSLTSTWVRPKNEHTIIEVTKREAHSNQHLLKRWEINDKKMSDWTAWADACIQKELLIDVHCTSSENTLQKKGSVKERALIKRTATVLQWDKARLRNRYIGASRLMSSLPELRFEPTVELNIHKGKIDKVLLKGEYIDHTHSKKVIQITFAGAFSYQQPLNHGINQLIFSGNPSNSQPTSEVSHTIKPSIKSSIKPDNPWNRKKIQDRIIESVWHISNCIPFKVTGQTFSIFTRYQPQKGFLFDMLINPHNNDSYILKNKAVLLIEKHNQTKGIFSSGFKHGELYCYTNITDQDMKHIANYHIENVSKEHGAFKVKIETTSQVHALFQLDLEIHGTSDEIVANYKYSKSFTQRFTKSLKHHGQTRLNLKNKRHYNDDLILFSIFTKQHSKESNIFFTEIDNPSQESWNIITGALRAVYMLGTYLKLDTTRLQEAYFSHEPTIRLLD